ncbi:hypothetical protein A5784_34880 [Mycobacterium sp. 852013-50091_SCH5140682]|nr:hypothetical protein A5784_34880 [Mycobacterium sp. 852013-50091_SCH5140682]
MVHDQGKAIEQRLSAIDPSKLSDEQAIQFAQAYAALLSSKVATDHANFVMDVIAPKLHQIAFIMDSDYRRKYGRFASEETG